MEKKNFKSKFFCLALSILLFNGFNLNVQADEITKPTDDDNTDLSEQSNIINSEIINTESEIANTESETKTDNGIEFEGIYDSLEEAENKAEEKEDEYYDEGYENVQTEIEKIEDTEGKDVQVGVDFVTTEDYQTALSKDEALNLKLELEQDDTVTITISEGYEVIDYVQEEKIIEKEFDSEDKALEYINSLIEEGYRVNNIVFVNNTEEETITQTFEDADAINTFLEEFEKTHTNIEITITPEYDSKEDTEIEKNEGTTGYDNIEDAKEEAERIENSVSEEETYYLVATVRGPQAIREETITKEFTSKQNALDYLESLKNNNYEVVEYKFTNDTIEENRTITDMDEYDSDTFDTESQANEALQSFLDKYNNASGSVTPIYDSNENEYEEIQKSKEGYLTLEEAEKIANSLKEDENSDKTYYIIATVSGKELVESVDLSGEFKSKTDADKFVEELKNQGYTIVGYEFIKDTQTNDMTLVQTYDEMEQAQNAYDKFVEDCDDGSVTGGVTEERDETKDTLVQTTTGTTGYDNIEDAKEEAERIENSVSEEERYYLVATVRGPESLNITEQINQELTSESDVQAYLESLEAQGYVILNYTYTHNTEEQERTITDMDEYNSDTFDTESQANEALQSFLDKYNNASGSVTPIYDSSENEYEEEVIEETWYTEYNKALEEAQKLEVAEDSGKTYYIIATVTGPTTTTTVLEGNFNSVDKANEFVEELKNQGYVIENYAFINYTEVKEVSLNQTYEERSQAEDALQNFEETYQNVQSKPIEEIYDEEGTLNKEGESYSTNEYTSQSDAQSALDAEKAKTDNTYLITGTISNRTETTAITSKQFNTEEEAQAYIDQIEKEGYDVSGITKELLTLQDGYWVTQTGVKIVQSEMSNEEFEYNHFDVTLQSEFTKENEDGTTTTVNGQMYITEVIINGTTIEMTGPTLDSSHGLYEYTSVERNNLEINNNTYAKITGYIILEGTTERLPFTIEGYLDENFNVCGAGENINPNSRKYNPEKPDMGSMRGFDIEFGEVKIIDEKVYIESNLTTKYYVSGNKSQVLYKGDLTKYEKDYDYKVSATGEETVTLDTGYITGTKTLNQYFIKTQRVNKGYDYKVNASGTETITLDSGVLTGQKEKQGYYIDVLKYNKGYKYKVNASGKKTITLESGKITGTKELYKYFINTQKVNKGYDYKVNASGTETITLESGELIAKVNKLGYYVDTVKMSKGYDYILKVTGTKTLESGKLNADTQLDIYKTVYDIDYTKAVPVYERQYFDKYKVIVTADEMEIENPKTGDDNISFIYLQILSLIGLLYSGIKLKIRK